MTRTKLEELLPKKKTRKTKRDKLIELLNTSCVDEYGELQAWAIADFIMTDRERIIEPLIKWQNAPMKPFCWSKSVCNAIQRTIKRSEKAS